MMRLDEQTALTLARIGLRHVERAYPHKLDHVLADAVDASQQLTPAALHPVFFGSLDWHSCCHTYWMLARLLRRYPTFEAGGDIRALFDRRLVPEHIAAECAYFARPSSRTFERPYGWAWLLKLAAELSHLSGEPWDANLRPLSDLVAGRLRAFLPLATYPIRVGTHGNTAFAVALASDYAAAVGDFELRTILEDAALRWYANDWDCQAWEPGGDDFLSSALVEAECMRRLLSRDRFAAWFDVFLPRVERCEPVTLFRPVASPDRSDGKLAHLDGLNLSRAWCFRALSIALADGDPRVARLQDAATRHLEAGLPFVAGDYMGEHWLGSFALLALDE